LQWLGESEEEPMGQLTRLVAAGATVVAIACESALTTGTETALADGTSTAGHSTLIPLSSILRQCDLTTINYVPSDTTGTGYAVISRSGSTVTAEVHMTGVRPDIWYGVRLVQIPRTTVSCNAGDPGVGMGRLYTDFAGNGTATVSAPVMPGATGAWVSVEGPVGGGTMLSGDYRTSDYAATI
jgi:hypothetical protein